MMRLAPGVGARVRAAAEAAYPNECCGFLLGQAEAPGRTAVDSLPVANSREAAEQYHRFVIEAEDFLRAEREAAARGQDIVGIYHSHPDHPAVPSDYDRDHALPFYSYVIVPVAGGGVPGGGTAGVARSWELDPETRLFAEEPLAGAAPPGTA